MLENYESPKTSFSHHLTHPFILMKRNKITCTGKRLSRQLFSLAQFISPKTRLFLFHMISLCFSLSFLIYAFKPNICFICDMKCDASAKKNGNNKTSFHLTASQRRTFFCLFCKSSCCSSAGNNALLEYLMDQNRRVWGTKCHILLLYSVSQNKSFVVFVCLFLM